ncbi:MAG: penicillin acylase family protein, partial [Candidatus Latescibacterota bacterium]|nr:penicillin acylase family protein [Candidatus Latescibacterota bacterium]
TREPVLTSRGDRAQRFNSAGRGARGYIQCAGKPGGGPDWEAQAGGGFRMIADLSDAATLLTVDAPSQSGHVGSTHYKDQLADWLSGDYHELPLHRERTTVRYQQTLQPDDQT